MRVVIVDDNLINLKLAESMLKKHTGCATVCFANSTKALDWCKSNDTDLLIVDYMMPAPNGLEFVREFRSQENKAGIPVMMMTASNQKHVRDEALWLGVLDFIAKPVDKNEFVARVTNMLDLRRRQIRLVGKSKPASKRAETLAEELAKTEQQVVDLSSNPLETAIPDNWIHMQCTAQYARHIAKNLDLSCEDQNLIANAMVLLDNAGVGVYDAILGRPGRLLPEEIEQVKRNALMGYTVIANSDQQVLKLAASITQSLQERYDGSGYPNALTGEEIPLFTRIVAVAKVFGALTAEARSNKVWTIKDALNFIVARRGKDFDPNCVRALLMNWSELLEMREAHYDGAAFR